MLPLTTGKMQVPANGEEEVPQDGSTILPIARETRDTYLTATEGVVMAPMSMLDEYGQDEGEEEDRDSTEGKEDGGGDDKEDDESELELPEGEDKDVGHSSLDKEDEYDWEVEAKKPAKTRGFQSRGDRQPFRYGEMEWEQRNGRWRSTWRWSEWQDYRAWSKRVEDQEEYAIRAWNVADAPQEILLRIVESLIGRDLSFAREVEDAAKAGDYLPPEIGLHNFALVCRAWYTLVAPALYSRLEARGEVPGTPLRHSVAQYARRIIVKTDRPFTSSARIFQINPRPSPVMDMEWQGEENKEAPYHPSHALIYTQIHRSYSNIVKLDLWWCAFLSSSDLLRLLAAFSALEWVGLLSVSVGHVSDSVVRQQRPSRSPIRYIFTNDAGTPPGLPFVTQCWTWPWSSSQGRTINALLRAEQQLVARVSRLTTVRRTCHSLDPIDSSGRAWVAMSQSNNLGVEYHACQDDLLHPGAARVHHCLLRLRTNDHVPSLTEGMTTIGDTLNCFVYLETIVLETSHQLKADEVQSLLESLRKVSRVEVQHRTCEDAHKLALQAKKSPSRSTSAALLSPFWCLQVHAKQWGPSERNWLSEDYWNSLTDEDKQGWDPSRPPAISAAAGKR